MRLIRFAGAALFSFAMFGTSLSAQTPAKLEFEVATVKPMPPLQTISQEIQSGKRSPGSIGMSITDTRIDLGYISLQNLLMMAYKMKMHQIVGPEWLAAQRFEIHAKIPEGATKEQLPEMIQSLLAERFRLATHRETKELPSYELRVSKNGHKMKEALPIVPTPDNPAQNGEGSINSQKLPEIKQEKGGLSINAGAAGQARVSFQNGAMAFEFSRLTMQELSDILTMLVDQLVIDRTDLKGAYQVALEVPLTQMLGLAQKLAGIPLPPSMTGASSIAGAASDTGGPGASDPKGDAVFDAVRKLGLKLDSVKAPLEMLVIDHIEQTPTED